MLLALGILLAVVAVVVVIELIIYVLGGIPVSKRIFGRLSRRVAKPHLFRFLFRVASFLRTLIGLELGFLRRLFGKK